MTAHFPLKGRRPPHQHSAEHRPCIALLTDFGLRDHYVGAMKGVIASIAPESTVLDLTHDIPPQNIRSGAYALWASYRFFPSGTVFVCVVDPGVGGKRAIELVWNKRYTWIAPQNGILDFILSEEQDLRAIKVDAKNSPLTLGGTFSTFHGRDIFAPIAAYLTRGVNPATLGKKAVVRKPSSPFISTHRSREGVILHSDRFGNCITNIRSALMNGIAALNLRGSRVSRIVRNYEEAPDGMVCLIEGSSGLIEMCLTNGSAADHLGVKPGQAIAIEWK